MRTDNELIAEFMEWDHCNSPACIESNNLCWSKDCHSGYMSKDLLKFDKSWDWLMPVVEKISQIHDSNFKYDFTQIKQGNWPADNEYMEVIALPLATPILDVHKAVVQFIKWYNQNPTQS